MQFPVLKDKAHVFGGIPLVVLGGFCAEVISAAIPGICRLWRGAFPTLALLLPSPPGYEQLQRGHQQENAGLEDLEFWPILRYGSCGQVFQGTDNQSRGVCTNS